MHDDLSLALGLRIPTPGWLSKQVLLMYSRFTKNPCLNIYIWWGAVEEDTRCQPLALKYTHTHNVWGNDEIVLDLELGKEIFFNILVI